ncbi:MAG: hypothetical protein CL811_04850 [Colwelliaceae bacterium]|nr:hypothetical protein [Colwelliaceae bacterium]
MAVTFTNNWKNILDKLESVLEGEFKGALPVYKGSEIPKGVSQAIRLFPLGSIIKEHQDILSETREYSIGVEFVFKEINLTETALDHILRYVSRIQLLIRKNSTMTLADSTNAWNGRIETEEFSTDEESGANTTSWEFKCSHAYIVT